MRIYYTEEINRKAFIRKVIDRYSGDLTSKKNIFLKPNIVSGDGYPATTHPDLLEELILQLTAMGKQVHVAEGPALDRGKNLIQKTDLYRVCRKHDTPIVNFRTCKAKTVNSISDHSRYRIYQMPFEYDYLISLPVLKTHKLDSVMMTCALKNQFAFIANLNKLKLHLFNTVNKAIADVNTLIRPDLFIIDAEEVLMNANEIRYGGVPKKCGVLFCGSDPVALDSYGFSLLQQAGERKIRNKTREDIPYLVQAERLGLGSSRYAAEKI